MSGMGDLDYCLSQPAEERCKLEFSLHIMVTVIICNAAKAVVMGLAVWTHRIPTLVTVGDAIASFLEAPDPFTEGMCLVTKSGITQGARKEPQCPISFKPTRKFYLKCASSKRWMWCIAL